MSYPVKMILTLLLLFITGCTMPLPVLPPTTPPVPVAGEGNCPDTGSTESLVRNDAMGYCFHIPAGYEAESFAEAGSLVVLAPTTSPGHRERLILSVEDALGRTLEQVTEQLLIDNTIPGFDFEVSDTSTVGGEAATVVGRLPGQDLNRRVLVVHGGRVYRMMFMPDEAGAGQPYAEMEALFATLMNSFTFIPPTAPLGISFPNAKDAGYPAQATLAWERHVYGDGGAITECQRLAITGDGATWAGSCEQAEVMTESGAYQWAEIVQRFAPFVYRSGEWDLTFAGQGEIYHPAWQRALVYWAQTTYGETIGGRVSATGRTALSWWLGVAEEEEGLCKHLVVLSHGYAYANLTPCEGGEAQLVAEGWLETREMAAFDGWLSTAAPTYVDENYLDGRGEQELDSATLVEIAAWADHVYTTLVPTSTPTPTNAPAVEVTPDPTVYFPTAEEIDEMQQLTRYLIDSIPQPMAAPAGWVIRPCEGSAPTLCIETETGETGAVELGAYPLRTYPDLHPILVQHGLPLGEIDTGSQSYQEGAPHILAGVAAEALSTLAADRAIGRPQWQFAPLDIKSIAFGSLPGLQYGFVMTDSEGVVRERVLSHVAFDESHIYFIGAAYDPEAVWSVASDETLRAFEPYLLDIIASFPLPKDSSWRP